jgi:hypothetical protein
MRQVEPAFFIHSGDTIYADGPIAAEQQMPDGGIWKNLTTEAKAKVAETLAEFRGNYAYNLMDEHVGRFNAAVPMFAQWDDHEVTNNWYPHEDLAGDPKKADYKVTSVDLLAARAAHAFMDYMPVRQHPLERSGCMPLSAMVPRWTCSGSTCARTAARTRRTTRPPPAPRLPSSAASRCAGSSRHCSPRTPPGR